MPRPPHKFRHLHNLIGLCLSLIPLLWSTYVWGQIPPEAVLKGTLYLVPPSPSPSASTPSRQEQVLTLVLTRYIEQVLGQHQKGKYLSTVIGNSREYVTAYAFENFSQTPEGKITYVLHIKWSEAWIKLLTGPSASSTSRSSDLIPYWITLEDSLLALLPQSPLTVLKAIALQLEVANTIFHNTRVLIPLTPLEKMLSPFKLSELCQHSPGPGIIEMAYRPQRAGGVREEGFYHSCEALNASAPEPQKRTLLFSQNISLEALLTTPPITTRVLSWAILYSPIQSTPLPSTKKYFVRLTSEGKASTWTQQDEPLNQSLHQKKFIESISLYSISQEQKTLELELRDSSDDLQTKLTQDLVSFCKKLLVPCKVSLEDTPTQALWLVQVP